MFGHRPKPRKFNMPLRYYNPEEDEKKKRRIRIKVRRRKDRYGTKIFLYVAGLTIVLLVISML
jgi:hypothetical protein